MKVEPYISLSGECCTREVVAYRYAVLLDDETGALNGLMLWRPDDDDELTCLSGLLSFGVRLRDGVTHQEAAELMAHLDRLGAVWEAVHMPPKSSTPPGSRRFDGNLFPSLPGGVEQPAGPYRGAKEATLLACRAALNGVCRSFRNNGHTEACYFRDRSDRPIGQVLLLKAVGLPSLRLHRRPGLPPRGHLLRPSGCRLRGCRSPLSAQRLLYVRRGRLHQDEQNKRGEVPRGEGVGLHSRQLRQSPGAAAAMSAAPHLVNEGIAA